MERPPVPAASQIPEAARRLFHGYADADLYDPSDPEDPSDIAQGRSLLISRLLEDGDSADLAWLCRNLSEEELGAWLESRGGRQLSVRSRAFWEVVLGRAAGPAAPAGSALWPL